MFTGGYGVLTHGHMMKPFESLIRVQEVWSESYFFASLLAMGPLFVHWADFPRHVQHERKFVSRGKQQESRQTISGDTHEFLTKPTSRLPKAKLLATEDSKVAF